MKSTPTGKAAVMKAVIEAATDLFSEKPPSRVSIREIAAKAGVNHGLIHRHFGAKQNLIRAVLSNIDSQIRAEASKSKSLNDSFEMAADAVFKDPRRWRIPARLIFDGQEALLKENQTSFLKDLRDAAEGNLLAEGNSKQKASESIMLVVALGFGMEIFGDYISHAMGIERPEHDELLKRIMMMLPGND